MSEIKGQLLGIVLAIAVFGVVAGALTAAFTTVSEDVAAQITNATSIETGNTSTSE